MNTELFLMILHLRVHVLPHVYSSRVRSITSFTFIPNTRKSVISFSFTLVLPHEVLPDIFIYSSQAKIITSSQAGSITSFSFTLLKQRGTCITLFVFTLYRRENIT